MGQVEIGCHVARGGVTRFVIGSALVSATGAVVADRDIAALVHAVTVLTLTLIQILVWNNVFEVVLFPAVKFVDHVSPVG